MSLELLGAAYMGDGDSDSKGSGSGGGGGGFGVSSWLGPILQLAGGAANAGISIAEQEQAANKKADDDRKATAADLSAAQTAITADMAASLAAAKATTSAQLKQASAAIDKSAAEMAASAQDRAGSGLSPAASDRRVKAAETALSAATSKAQANPKDVYSTALMNAWTATLNKASNRQIVSNVDGGGKKGKGGPSWFDGKTGPVPNKVVAGVGVLGVAGLAWKFLIH